jgi:2-succinyl-5-enolpyruvyl-6-hydroxy-3-cyclohexene-1-carboxylate synthase
VTSAAPNVSTLWGRVLADELARCGLRHAVIAPGSRSTPLVVALAEHPDVFDHSVIDERSAAFVALGLARATGRPAAVVTTSGTAAANLLPAVLEADRAGVPLLLLTADRPPELRDAGDSQSADQVKLFGDRVRWFHLVAEPAADDGRLRYLRSTACEAWARAAGSGGPPGPVHLDLPFRKPLEPTPVAEGEAGALPAGFDPEAPGAAGRPGGAPWRRLSVGRPAPDPEVVEELGLALAGALAGAERPLVLAGALDLSEVESPAGARPEGPLGLRQALAALLAALPLPVWAEATSQLRLAPLDEGGGDPDRGETAGGAVIGTAGLLLGSGRLAEAARPDLVLRLGEAPLDWPLRRFAERLAAEGVPQWAIDPWGRRRDPEHAVARTVAADPALLLRAVAGWLARHRPAPATDPGWLPLHRAADRAAREALDRAMAGRDDLFDGGVLHRLGRHLPEDAALVLSSSMPLREAESFLISSERPADVFANRGLNGIDGVTSTAVGVAAGRRAAGESRTVLVTGDVAFAHDLSGALAAARSGSDLVVVLLDNGGGAIFDHLPAAGLLGAAFERHLATPPGADLGAVARGLGWTCAEPASWPALEEELAAAFEGPRGAPHLIRVATDRRRTKEIRDEVLREVAGAVDEALG